jgi:hypothetical protein
MAHETDSFSRYNYLGYTIRIFKKLGGFYAIVTRNGKYFHESEIESFADDLTNKVESLIDAECCSKV